MGQYRRAGFGRGAASAAHAPRLAAGAGRAARRIHATPARLARHVAAAALISAGMPFGAACAADVPAATQTPSRKTYDIPAGPLEATLNRFGRETGLLLSFPAALTAGRHSGGLRGDYEVSQAFTQILQGTGLAAVRQANGSYTLVE